jgi:hypothetical protein
MELPNVASSYSKNIMSEGQLPKDFFERVVHANKRDDARHAKIAMTSTTAAMEVLVNVSAKNSPKHNNSAPRTVFRSPYDSPEGRKNSRSPNASARHPSSALRILQSPPLSPTTQTYGSDSISIDDPLLATDLQKSSVYQLESDPPQRGFSAKSGSSNFSRAFSASECSLFYSPSRCSGMSSNTNRSTVSDFKIPSVCMMSEYSAENYQNRRLGTPSRLRGLKHIDFVLSKSIKELFIEKNGGGRSCMLASQKQHSNLRSACPRGTIIAKDDLAKYNRLRHCNPNIASRELGFALHTTIHVQDVMKQQHGE